MIITIAGTSGAGKSYAMYKVLSWLEHVATSELIEQEGRKAPLATVFTPKEPLVFQKQVVVLGAYETPTGGCDTIKRVEDVFELVREYHQRGMHVLYEGLFVMNHTRGPQLAAAIGRELVVLQLQTPLETCLASVTERRAVRGKEALEQTKNVKGNHVRANNYCAKMRDAGASVVRCTRTDVLPLIQNYLKEAQ